ncbi:peptide/nickel transport system ATP-binding protein [Jatrophihabitans endophyticus]|uniref:Peptide/nickel transport system ATP-binding protein n=1 Tax=Jatrophihabitans endophyticus TaxID=1206085 RepID=A0A1M5I0A6_9ACTN|nr:ABC transporter ATP-binding protein [Jatrophihabitans endophyticus]SHG21443.1 peptide/nickel transport system ATP-binding protein [Jatrophihabitans endophyticus]
MSEPVLDVENLRVWYAGAGGPVRAVDGVDFTLRPGEVLGLVGESGCGKSTLGRGLMGLVPRGAAVDGRIDFDGRSLLTLSTRQRERLRGAGMGLIFQEPMTRLDPLMRVSDHFEEALRTHAKELSKKERETRALESLRALGIPPTRYRNYPHEFSGGMRQRIMIALALALRPKFIVADEPTTALDVLVEAQILRILADIRDRFAPAILLITHNLGIIAEACDRVAVMYAGRIVEQGPVDAVFASPQHPYTRELLRSTISLTTQELHSIPGAPPDLVAPPTGCNFHPRCPSAMRVCASRDPIPRTLERQRVECWLHETLSDEDARPLENVEVSVADEA